MKAVFEKEEKENAIEIYLTAREIKKLYEEDKAVLFRHKDFLNDGRFTYFYIGKDLKE